MENLKRFLVYYKPFKKLILLDLFFAALASATNLLYPLIVRAVTNEALTAPKPVALDYLIKAALLMLFLAIVEYASNYFIAYIGHVTGAKIEFRMRNDLFDHLQKLSFGYFDDAKTGQIMSRITTDLFDVTELAHHGPEDIVISLIKIFGALIILLNINPTLTLLIFAILPFMLFFTFRANRKMKKAFHKNRQNIADINATIEDSISGIRVVKSFANEEVEIRRFQEGNEQFVQSKTAAYRIMGRFHSGLGFFITLINSVVVLLGGLLIIYGWLNLQDLLTFMLYINLLIEPVRKLINFTEQFQNGYTGFERFVDIMNIEPDVKDKPNAVEITSARGDISFRDVSFRYGRDSSMVLKNVNLEISSGDYVALVGSSGVGKTTLCSLLPRFYDTTRGQVLLDGTNIRDLTLASLRKQIGIVQQDVYLFSGTIRDNIRYGRQDATEEEIIAAAKNANAHDFIMQLPEGYDTYAGQRGIKLSGGQKQRISIARVFLKNPPILIFDEATSALDNESERVIQESFDRLAKGRTTLVIAHRLSTIKNAQRILVLTEDGIAEDGSHDELMAKQGVYHKFYSLSLPPGA